MWVHNATPEIEAASRWPLILAVCVIVSAVMVGTVVTRLFTRARIVQKVGWDDYTIVGTAIFSLVYNALCITQTRYGLGLPLDSRPQDDMASYSKVNYAGRPIYQLGIAGFKVSICIAVLRLAQVTRGRFYKIFRASVWLSLGIIVLGHIAGTLILLFQCDPVKKSWLHHTPGQCLPEKETFYALAVFSIICDLIAFSLPIPLVLAIDMSRKTRIALTLPLALGLFTTLCSILRILQVKPTAKDGDSTMLILWGTIEFNVGIIAACLPTLSPIFKELRSRLPPVIASIQKFATGKAKQQEEGTELTDITVTRQTEISRSAEPLSAREFAEWRRQHAEWRRSQVLGFFATGNVVSCSSDNAMETQRE